MPYTFGQFIVNGIKAEVDDFRYMDWEDGEFYECINHRFIGFDKPKAEVLRKYMKKVSIQKHSLYTDTLDKEREYYQNILIKFGLSETDAKTISMFAIYNRQLPIT